MLLTCHQLHKFVCNVNIHFVVHVPRRCLGEADVYLCFDSETDCSSKVTATWNELHNSSVFTSWHFMRIQIINTRLGHHEASNTDTIIYLSPLDITHYKKTSASWLSVFVWFVLSNWSLTVNQTFNQHESALLFQSTSFNNNH